jgi:hypothetical protein
LKVWIIVLAAILVGSNLFWFGQFLNAGINHTTTLLELKTTRKALDTAFALANLNLIGLDVAEARQKINTSLKSEPSTTLQGSCIYIEKICVRLDNNGTVIEITP